MLVPIPCTSRREHNSFRSGPDLPGRERICLAMQQSCACRRLQQHRRDVVFCVLLSQSQTQRLRPSEKPSNDFGRRRGREILGVGWVAPATPWTRRPQNPPPLAAHAPPPRCPWPHACSAPWFSVSHRTLPPASGSMPSFSMMC